MTINKAQDQTVKHVGLNVNTSVFFHTVLVLETSKLSFLMIKEIPKSQIQFGLKYSETWNYSLYLYCTDAEISDYISVTDYIA